MFNTAGLMVEGLAGAVEFDWIVMWVSWLLARDYCNSIPALLSNV